MSFMREGIDQVRTLALPDGVAADGSCVSVSGAALVTWRSAHAGLFHQVYVNGRFAGATIDAQQRQLVIQAPGSFETAVRIEVVAVEPKDAHRDFADQLAPMPAGSGRIRLTLLRSQALPIQATANVYCDNGTGAIDYVEPLNDVPIPIWPCVQDKAGFGMACFGAGDFGYDSAASIGFGRGSFGSGHFGLDADVIEWISPPLSLGRYRFGIKIIDARGNESVASETEAIAVVPAARPAAKVEVATFDPQTNRLTLSISNQI
jgi:hypothetical protein